ncbi:MAG TPA: TonB-dependent receptor [Puia sp.]|jgi:TonB-linked SusC/RagA family outer membrane protein
MKKMLLLLLLLFTSGLIMKGYSQGRIIKGKVTDESNKPLAGATVTLKGTTVNALTDDAGNFTINTGDQVSPVLVVTFVGYTNEDFNVKGRTSFTIRMQQDIHALGDVVVVGYGVQRKRDVTGATSKVSAEEISKRPLVRVEQALQGTTSGVVVQSNSGQPGQGLSVRIRGTNSITGGNDPLYVIDGFIGGDISSLSMSDIESLEILKDASATAIYGSRGSNGVVIITTKMGKIGKARIDFDPWFSKAEIPKKLSLMNAYQFAVATNAYNAVLGQSPSFSPGQVSAFQANPAGTDWQNAVTQKPWIQNYQLSVSGGSDAVQYLFSFNHLDQPGLLINSYYKKTTLRANVDVKVNDRLNLKFNVSTLMPQSRNNGYAGDITDPFAQAYQWDPTSPIRDSNGNFILKSNYASNQLNPVAQLTNGLDDNSSTSVIGTGTLTYRILDGLTFTSNNTYETESGFEQIVQGPQTESGQVNSDYSQINSNKSHNWQNSNYFTYQHRFGDHALTLTALYEQQVGENTSVTAKATNLSTYSNGYYNLGLGAAQATTSGYSSDALQSYMGRVNYSYKDKYLLTASLRSDGSSHLTQKYSSFPSVAVGWNLAKEKFMEGPTWISDLKLRAGYGESGNQAVGAYSTIAQVTSGRQGPYGNVGYFYDGSTLSVGTPLGTPVTTTLKWEDDATTDIGLDAAFFHGRITFTADAYYKKITNLLYSKPIPQWDGGGSYSNNIGTLENKGIEFALGGTPIAEGKFKWSTNFTISFNQNKVLSLGGLDSIVEGNIGSAQSDEAIIVTGRSLGNFYGYKFEGTWKTSEATQAAALGMKPGDSKYVDVNGDNKYTAADLMVIGNGTPKYSFGWINDFSYGAWTLSMMFQGTHGNQIYSGTIPYTFGGLGDARNATTTQILNVWTAAHQTDIPTFDPSSNNAINSSRYVYDASYIKLKNFSLGYRLPQNLLNMAKIHSIELYVSGQNIFTITHYPGYDPEVTNANFGSHPAVAQGLETGVVPNPRTYTFGLRASF